MSDGAQGDSGTSRDSRDGRDSRDDDDPGDLRDASDAVDGGRRDVEVPLEVYKAVTVFSTLFAVIAIVGGFVVLDRATQRATAAPEDVDVLLVVLGLGAVALGAATYAFSTRFRAPGMGKSKDEAAEPPDDG